MGAPTFVKRIRPDLVNRPRRRVSLDIDVPLLLVMITIMLFGLVMVYSASWDYSYLNFNGNSSYIIVRQLMMVGIGLVAAIIAAFFFDYRWFKQFALPIMGVTIILLILVLFVGEERLGARRGLFGGSFQPSELAKLATVIYLAVWLTNKRDQLDTWGFGLLPLAGILGIVGASIVIQPDLSAAMTVIVLGGLMFFLAGGDMRRIGLLVVMTLVIGVLFVMLSQTGQDRIGTYMQGLEDPTLASYHVRRSMEALARGGLFGVGIGKADTKLTGLPVPPTDSIFAVIGEETGVLGGVFVISLYILILWRSLSIARRAPDALGSLLAAGLGLWLVMEAIINISVIVGLFPFAGNALPFISAGGSSLVVSMTAIGILMNISRSGSHEQEKKESVFNALIDFRRGDRRRRVSRPSRTSSPDQS